MNLRAKAGVACLVALLDWGAARAGDVRPLSHPVGSPASTSNALSFVSSRVSGTYAPASCFGADGRFVTFASWGQDLVPGQVTLAYVSVYETDLSTGATRIVSHDATSPTTTGNGPSTVPAISTDGRWIAYESGASNLVAGMTRGNPDWDVFLYDRLTGENILVSHRQGELLTGGNGASYSPWVSADGAYVAFLSTATDLIAGEVLAHSFGTDVFLYDRLAGTTTLVSRSAIAPSQTGNGMSGDYVASADGRFIAFTSSAADLVVGQQDSNSTWDVFVFDRILGAVSLVSRQAGSSVAASNDMSQTPSISADGRFIAFYGQGANLIPFQSGIGGIFLFDQLTGNNTLVSHPPGSPSTAVSISAQPQISADGSAVAYRSTATNLVAGQSDPSGMTFDVFVFDRASGVNTLVSRSAASAFETGNADSLNPVISADGNRVAFESFATDLVPGQIDTNGALDVFEFDRLSGTTILVSRTPGSAVTTGNAGSNGPLLSTDVNLVAFNSDATNLVLSDANASADAFLFRAASFGSAGSLSPLDPCRLVDTRSGSGLAGGSAIAASSTRDFTLTGLCGVPADVTALSLNVTITQPRAAGSVDVFPAGLPTPPTAIVSFVAGQTRANNAIVSLGGTPSGTVTVRNASTGSVHVILDVNGFFR